MYASCEERMVERYNGLIRRFNPKGQRIDKYSSTARILDIVIWYNASPGNFSDAGLRMMPSLRSWTAFMLREL